MIDMNQRPTLLAMAEVFAEHTRSGRYEPEPKLVEEVRARDDRYLDLIEHLKSEILQALSTGSLVCVGYAEPRRPEDHLVEIPVNAWSSEIDWLRSEITDAGAKFIAVRVTQNKDGEI